MAAVVDLELKKAFTELQAKVIDTQQKVKLADLQIEQLNRTKKHAHLTDTEIKNLPDETPMYEGVGRIVVRKPRSITSRGSIVQAAAASQETSIEKSQAKEEQERFVLETKEKIHSQLLKKQKIADDKIAEIEQKKSYLERSVKEAEDNIREMLMARKSM
ncbi:prefoldin subunit 1 isoform X1 [Rhinoderma darwinii]|uniref:prefoldin subunit 1 isoform X1 n=2 Tax=Rhinoderma darwinii TaxID=43563 RepID=UPI003F66CFA4